MRYARPWLVLFLIVILSGGAFAFKGTLQSSPVYAGYDEILHIGNSTTEWGLTTSGAFGYVPTTDVPASLGFEFRSAKYLTPSTWSTIVAGPYFDINNTTPNANPTGGIGSDQTFMRESYIPNLLSAGRAVRTTTQAVGGTDPGVGGYWQVATSGVCWSDATAGLGVKTAVTRINGALAQRSTNQLKLILISLGTNNAIGSVSQVTFNANIQALITCLRNSIVDFSGTPVGNVPVLFQGLVPTWATCIGAGASGVDAALKDMPNQCSQCGYADMTGITGQNAGGVCYHLSNVDQRSMGSTRWLNAYTGRSP